MDSLFTIDTNALTNSFTFDNQALAGLGNNLDLTNAFQINDGALDLSGLVNEYNSHLVNMHQQVKVLDPKEPFEGKAMGITPKGELIVDTWESRKLVSTGEVSVRGIYGYV